MDGESSKAADKKAAGSSFRNSDLDQRFSWDERLHRKCDFNRVFQEGRRFSASGLTMWVRHPLETGGARKPRLGMAIPKAYGNAVARNRIKRLIRESFRLNKEKLPPGVDMVFSARPGAGLPAGRQAKPFYRTIEPLVLKLWTLAKLQPPSRGS